MAKIQIELPDETAKAARDAGLLTSQTLNQLLRDAMKRQQAADILLSIAERIQDPDAQPMSMDEIDLEVKAVRTERKKRAGSL